MLTESKITHIELELSADCNAECPLCARTDLNMDLKGNSNITLDQIKHIFPSEEHVKDKEIILCGNLGDPIVNPQCYEICEYLDQYNPKCIDISTNGGYNNAEWWTKLALIKSVRVFFAVDGHEETNHLYRINVNWKLLERNMRSYSEAGGTGTWVFIPFDHNDHEYEAAYEHAMRLGFAFKKCTSGRNELNNKKVKPRKHADVVVIKGSDIRQHKNLDKVKQYVEAQRNLNSENIAMLEKAAETITCKHLQRPEIYISAELTLWPCCYIHDNYIKDRAGQRRKKRPRTYLYGEPGWNDLNLHTIDEILQHDMYTTLRDMWHPTHPNYLDRCLKSCGDNAAYANKNEIISK